MSQGYLFIALGKRYIEECFLLSNTIRKTGDNRPISLLVYEEDIDFANNFIPFVHMFDKMEGQNFRILYEKIMRNNYD